MSFISHSPIAGDLGEIALFEGSYQFLQNAHFLLCFTLIVSDAISYLLAIVLITERYHSVNTKWYLLYNILKIPVITVRFYGT